MPTGAIVTTASTQAAVFPSVIVITSSAGDNNAATERGLKAIYIAGIVIGTIAVTLATFSMLVCLLLIRHHRRYGRRWPRLVATSDGVEETSPISTADTIKVDVEAKSTGSRRDAPSTPVKQGSKWQWPRYYRMSPPPHMLLLPRFRRSYDRNQSDTSTRQWEQSEEFQKRPVISGPMQLNDSPLRQHPVDLKALQHKSKGKSRVAQGLPSPPLRSPLRPARPDPSAPGVSTIRAVPSTSEIPPERGDQALNSDGIASPFVPASTAVRGKKTLARQKLTPELLANERKITIHGHARCDSATDIDVSDDDQTPQNTLAVSSSRAGMLCELSKDAGNRSPIADLNYPGVPEASNVRSIIPGLHANNFSPSMAVTSFSTSTKVYDKRSKLMPPTIAIPGSAAAKQSATSPVTPKTSSAVVTRLPTPFAPPRSSPAAAMAPSPATVTGTSLMHFNDPHRMNGAMITRQAGTWPGDSRWQRQHHREIGRRSARRKHRERSYDTENNVNDQERKQRKGKAVRRPDLPQSDVYDFF